MASADRKESFPAISPQAAEEMVRYGIRRVPVDYFFYRDFRHNNSKDAVAHVKREQRPE